MRERVTSVLVDLLRRRIGHAGPWPAELYRFVSRMALANGSDELTWLLSIEQRPADLVALIGAATVGHTRFYRHEEHFEQLRKVLPKLSERSVPLRVWSAGCSTGEEAWSLALLLQSHAVPFQLLATDVNEAAVTRARAGIYRASETKHLPGYDGKLSFSPSAELRACVRFEQMALLDKLPPYTPRSFDVIFCRNVLIYLESEHLKAVWKRLVSLLAPWGVIAVAPVESLTNVPEGLVRTGPLGWLQRGTAPARPAAQRVADPASARSHAPRAPSLRPSAPRAGLPLTRRASVEPNPVPTPDPVDGALEEVGRHLAAGEARLAEQRLHRLLAERDDAFGWFLLGEACVRRGANAEARIAFERAATAPLTSGNADLDTIRAAALRRAKQLPA